MRCYLAVSLGSFGAVLVGLILLRSFRPKPERSWLSLVPGWCLDASCAFVFTVILTLCIARGDFGARVPLSEALNAFLHLPPVFLGVSAVVAVAGALTLRYLRRQVLFAEFRGARHESNTVIACIAAALALHVVFVTWNKGLYENGATPPEAWYGAVASEVSPTDPSNVIRVRANVPSSEPVVMAGTCTWFGPRFGSSPWLTALSFLAGILLPTLLAATSLALIVKHDSRWADSSG